MWDKIKEAVKPFAPVLAGALSMAGPIGAGAAIALKAALTGDEEASEEEVLAAVHNMTPEQKLSLQESDNQFKLQMRQFDLQEEAVHQQDRASARAREIATDDNVPSVLAYVLTAGFFILLFSLMFFQIPASSKGILEIMLGVLGTAWIAVISYYFGSSSGSKAKDRYIEGIKK